MNYDKLFDAKISGESIAAWRAGGKKALGVLCCFIPNELLYAADIMPVRLRATGCNDYSEAEVWMSSFSCSFAKSILQYLIEGTYDLDGIIVTDGCMQAVRVYDNWKWICDKVEPKEQFIFELGVPRMRTDITREFYKHDVQELAAELEKLSGNKITDEKLKKAVSLYNEQRRLVGQLLELQKADKPVITGTEALSIMLASSNMPVEEYNELLAAFLADAKNRKPVEGYRARVMIIGSALDTPEYINTIEKKGGLVVADTLCFGTMAYNEMLELDENDVLGSISNYYLKHLVCPRMIDNRDELHEFILKRIKDYKVDGVIYEKMQNCECWGGENVYLEQELKDIGVPELNVEREQKLANMGQLEIRAEAFIEMIEKED